MTIGHPDSTVWCDEELVVLEFSRAVLQHAVTDELFARYRGMGTKGRLRRASWIGLSKYYLMFADLNVTDAARKGQVAES